MSKVSKRISSSYLVLTIFFCVFPILLNFVGFDMVEFTVFNELVLSVFIASLHLLFSLYLSPTAPSTSSISLSSMSQVSSALRLQRALVGFSVGTVVFYFISVLYGAPFFSAIFRTAGFAMLLSSMTAVPSALQLGSNPQNWKDLYFYPSHHSVYDTCCTIVVLCSLFGAWIGAFAIPLDWDRPWQLWPISCVYSSLFGHFIGLLACTIYTFIYGEGHFIKQI